MKGWVDLVGWPAADGLPTWAAGRAQDRESPPAKDRRSTTEPTPKVVGLPEKDDESVEDVEAVLYVAVEAVADDLQHHLNTEQCREEQVDVLQHVRQSWRLTQRNIMTRSSADSVTCKLPDAAISTKPHICPHPQDHTLLWSVSHRLADSQDTDISCHVPHFHFLLRCVVRQTSCS